MFSPIRKGGAETIADTDKTELRRIISETELADRWGKSRRTLQRYRHDGSDPASIRIGGNVFYWTDDVEAFEAANRYGGEGSQ